MILADNLHAFAKLESYHGANRESHCSGVIFHDDVEPRNKNRRDDSSKAEQIVDED